MNPHCRPYTARAALSGVLIAVALAGCGGGGLDPILGTPSFGVAPTVTATTPLDTTPIVSGVAFGSVVSATFSQPMNAASLNATSFSLACPTGTPTPATVSYSATTMVATLTPTAPLAPSTVCTATLSTAVQSSVGIALATPRVWSFQTAPPADTTRPTVSVQTPNSGATGVATDGLVTASFSEAMNATTLTGTSFTLRNDSLGTAVPGTVSYAVASRTATFTPTGGTLANNTLYTATLTTAVTDSAGNGIAGNTAVAPAAGNQVWSFTTGSAPTPPLADTTRPTVSLNLPVNGDTAAATNSKVSASFSEAMNAATLNGTTFTLRNSTLNTPVTGTVSYAPAARTATFTPTGGTLAAATLYTATVTAAATDSAGNGLAGNTAVAPAAGNQVWTFTTGATAETVPPTVTAISPPDGSTAICQTRVVTATFSEAMDPATLTAANFGVTQNGVAVPGTVSYDAATRIATFMPTAASGFVASAAHVATLKSGVGGIADLAGNTLVADRTWTFTTSAQACVAGINLRSIAAFGAFGGAAGITNQGVQTVIGGNIGSTAACTLITGLHDATNVYSETPLNVGAVNGSIYCAPPAPGTTTTLAIAAQARADAQAAYNQLAALPPGSDPGAGQLGGLVLSAGTYTAAGGTFAVTSGDLTLDAQGDSNAIFVFQSASALTVGLGATPRRVLLVNGAQAKNVFWQVGSAARIEDGSSMVGTIIAPAGVTVSTAGQTVQTTLIGRAIGLTASVTLVNTTVVAP